MEKFNFILGASDPEMRCIEQLCKTQDHNIIYARKDKRRVHTANAYNAESCQLPSDVRNVWVECRAPNFTSNDIVIDHHAPGHPGFGMPPERFWEGSSLGQVCLLLEIPQTAELSIVAAADHCLGHAYRGQCPGVNVQDIKAWRIKSRAEYQGISEDILREQIEVAVKILRTKPIITINGFQYIDSGHGDLKEFPEASAIISKATIYSIIDTKSNRKKVGVLGGTPEEIKNWIEWAGLHENEIFDIYGDPIRGYAGGYKS